MSDKVLVLLREDYPGSIRFVLYSKDINLLVASTIVCRQTISDPQESKSEIQVRKQVPFALSLIIRVRSKVVKVE